MKYPMLIMANRIANVIAELNNAHIPMTASNDSMKYFCFGNSTL
jgi:hypothetical protein